MELQNVNLKLNETEKEITFTHENEKIIKLNMGGFDFKDSSVGIDYYTFRSIFNNLKKFILGV
ncbi:MAG TPA: hypothetical protein DEG69_18325 [Flavobacteriaceae bacterium]|nr:hypothetical protein [Flavobacteriaceae bacterium]|tara:strand:- start:1237 stop:1425 length:189 start_codon:yes stop_codon:yes gene_type:complete